MLRRAWTTQKRVLGALLMRDIQLRWGRRNLGFAWLVAEPLLFAFPVILMWSYLRGRSEHGISLIPFIWSGYLPLLVFRHITGRAIYVVRHNAAMLYHRSVTPLDLVIARSSLELMGGLAATLVSFIVLYALGVLQFPHNLPLFMAGNLYNAWWAISIGLVIAAASERTEIIEHIWMPISYMYLPVCGFIYLADWLPDKLRPIVLAIMPPLHSYEMIRGALFGNQIQVFYNFGYLTFLLALITALGLWLMRDVRRHLELDW